MLKTILVPVQGGPADRGVLASAFAMAAGFDAHVDAIHVRSDPVVALGAAGGDLPGTVLDTLTRQLEEANARTAAAALEAFEAERAAAGFDLASGPNPGSPRSAAWTETVGLLDPVLGRAARLADVTVVPGPGSGWEFLATEIMFGSGRPVLVASERRPARVGGTVAVAWDGSIPAARAVAAALPVLHRADRVLALTAGRGGGRREGAAGDLARYLGWHGIAAEPVFTPCEGDEDGVLLRELDRHEADLLVMGAYGHSRVRELVLGGFTRRLLSTPSGFPILMMH